MSLQVLHQPQTIAQCIAPMNDQYMQYSYHYSCIQKNNAIHHWSNISPRGSKYFTKPEEKHKQNYLPPIATSKNINICSSNDGNNIGKLLKTQHVTSQLVSSKSTGNKPTCLTILGEMDELDLAEPSCDTPNVTIRAETLEFVKQSNQNAAKINNILNFTIPTEYVSWIPSHEVVYQIPQHQQQSQILTNAQPHTQIQTSVQIQQQYSLHQQQLQQLQHLQHQQYQFQLQQQRASHCHSHNFSGKHNHYHQQYIDYDSNGQRHFSFPTVGYSVTADELIVPSITNN